MVQINLIHIEHQPLYGPNDEYIGDVNEAEFNDVRIQIAKQGLEGYYILFESKKVFINKFGVIPDWPFGMFDLLTDQIANLFRIQIEKGRLKT